MPFFFPRQSYSSQSFMRQHGSSSRVVMGWGIGLLLLSIGTGESVVASTYDNPSLSEQVTSSQVTFVPPTDEEPLTEGAGSRGHYCRHPSAIARQSIAALLPAESSYGLTIRSHPTFLVQLTNFRVENLIFTIKNEGGEAIYEARVPVVQRNGIVRVQMPDDAPPLEVNHLYEWGMIVPCSGRIRPDSPFVRGWIRRTSKPNLNAEFDNDVVPSVEMANRYGQAGLWYDMIATLDELTQQHPEDAALNRTWRVFLPSFNTPTANRPKDGGVWGHSDAGECL